MVRQAFNKATLLASAALLGACMAPGSQPPQVTRAEPAAAVPPAQPKSAYDFARSEDSEIILSLLARDSVIAKGSSFDQVAKAVLASNARVGHAELVSARLRQEAAAKNWLPRIGPSISLTSLSSIAASLLVEVALFDHGRKQAERAFAAADVEAAAVTLSEEVNDRVLTALSLYLEAEQARDEARISRSARDQMGRFAGIMEERVAGGVSDMTELRVIQTKLRELEAQAVRDQGRADAALAELNAMVDGNLANVRGLPLIATAPIGAKPLTLLKAEAIRERDIAQAVMDRADMLPGVSAGGSVGDGGSLAVNVSGENLVGLGTAAGLSAIEAQKEVANRRVIVASEESNRSLRRLSQRLRSMQAQEDASLRLVQDARENHRIFTLQFQEGARPFMDVINIYETAMRLERDHAGMKFEQAEVRLQIAAEFGALVDGSDI